MPGDEPAGGFDGREPPIDEATVAALERLAALDEDPRSLVKLVRAFMASASSLLGEITAAAQRGDPRALRRAAHGLKSSAGMFGALEAARSCEALEQLAHAHDERTLPDLRHEVASLRGGLSRAARAYQARLPALASDHATASIALGHAAPGDGDPAHGPG
jgi:HPt (histidine-containing phosphotransfer) domain-containing protein